MLFSHAETAAFLQERFEPAWGSLRPVPTFTVDFGDGRRVMRTFQGNVATFVCAADGTVIDVLPGLYDPPQYRAALERVLAAWEPIAPLDPAAREQALARYHGAASAARTMRSLSKCVLELPAKMVVADAIAGRPAVAVRTPTGQALRARVALDAAEAEGVGREGVHAILRDAGPVTPVEVVGRIYREVLHCDLDDPLLGLGPVLAGEEILRTAGEREVAANSAGR